MRRLTIVFAVLALLATTVPASADGGPRDADTDHFGPYASGSTDSGTCGNDWADDTFDRFFTVRRNADGSYTLREDFKNGKFVTRAGASPGACETNGTAHGAVIHAGVRGEFSGFLAGAVTGGTFNPAVGCPAPCSGTKFVEIHFGLGAQWTVVPFRFRYHANDADSLHFARWQNASPDQGGNKGDIAD